MPQQSSLLCDSEGRPDRTVTGGPYVETGPGGPRLRQLSTILSKCLLSQIRLRDIVSQSFLTHINVGSARRPQAPRPFRYTVTPTPRVYCFEPKRLPNESDSFSLQAVRASMFGALFAGRFSSLPTKMCNIVWEVSPSGSAESTRWPF